MLNEVNKTKGMFISQYNDTEAIQNDITMQ